MPIEIIRGLTSILTDAGMSRRSFLRGATAAGVLLAAPPVARAASLMDIRGVPLRSEEPEIYPCDGSILTEAEAPELFAALRKQAARLLPQEMHLPPELRGLRDGRQYGGEIERRTFAVPDFNHGAFDFGLGARASVGYEVDRNGDLYVRVKPVDSVRDQVDYELRISFGDDGAASLMRGERVKL